MEDIPSATSNEKEYLIEFIRMWETYPELWCTSMEGYRNKVKKNSALNKLLEIYKKIKPDSTIEDVRKKINSLRTNFRKELKQVIKSKSSGKGTDEIYVPSGWLYYELQFLTNDEQPVTKTKTETKNNADEEHTYYSVSSMDPPEPPTPSSRPNKIKKGNDQQTLLRRTISLLEKDSSENQEEYHLAKVWASKLISLEPMQKLIAEKAINDILFEAQLGKLDKHSVKVNEHRPYSSSPLPPRELLHHSKVNHIPSPSPSPNTQNSCLTYSSNPSPYSITFEHADNTRAQTFSKPLIHNQPNISTGLPSYEHLRYSLSSQPTRETLHHSRVNHIPSQSPSPNTQDSSLHHYSSNTPTHSAERADNTRAQTISKPPIHSQPNISTGVPSYEHVSYSSSPPPTREILHHSKVNHIPSPSPSPNTQNSCLTYSSNPSPHSITFEHADNTRAQTISKPPIHNQPNISTGVPFYEHVSYSSSPPPTREILHHSKVNHIPSPSPSPNTHDSSLHHFSSNTPTHSVERADNTRGQTFSKPSSNKQAIITTGIPSQIILRPTLTQSQYYVQPNTISQQSTYNMTSKVIITTADVHAEDIAEDNIAYYFKEFK